MVEMAFSGAPKSHLAATCFAVPTIQAAQLSKLSLPEDKADTDILQKQIRGFREHSPAVTLQFIYGIFEWKSIP